MLKMPCQSGKQRKAVNMEYTEKRQYADLARDGDTVVLANHIGMDRTVGR